MKNNFFITASVVGFFCQSTHLQSFSLHQVKLFFYLSRYYVNRIHPKWHAGFEIVHTSVLQLMHNTSFGYLLQSYRITDC